MAIVKSTKKKKTKLGGRRSPGGAARETSPLRPYWDPKTPPCLDACPNHNEIRTMLMTISRAEDFNKDYDTAFEECWNIWVERNPFPAVLGRVCPHPCEGQCNRNHKDGALNINQMERFIGDFGLQKGLQLKRLKDESSGKKIAVIGAGPAGLSCAYQLARQGHAVTVFEATGEPGGMLRWGIPAYRLPREILQHEIDRIAALGVELKCNTRVGTDVAFADLKNDYDGIFVGMGAHKGRLLGLEGEDASNVYTGTDFLHDVNAGKSVDIGNGEKKVIVIGGGNTAIDAARISRRLGADVTILYRRTIKEMPAIEEEIEGAQEEGIDIQYLAAPIGILRENGRATGLKCIKMELGEPDSSGRRRPVPIEGSEYEVAATGIVAAISQEPNFAGLENLREGRDWVKIAENFETQKEKGVFAGGDNINLALVIDAVAHGREAARAIENMLASGAYSKEERPAIVTKDRMKFDFYEEAERVKQIVLPPQERFETIDKEITTTFTAEMAVAEAKRCLSCGQCFRCHTCWELCQDSAIYKPLELEEPLKFKLDLCQGCKKCAEECPCGYIELM